MAVKRKKSNMKGMTIGKGMKRPTKSGAGMTRRVLPSIVGRTPVLNYRLL